MVEKKNVRLRVVSRMRDPEGDVHETKSAHRGVAELAEDRVCLTYEDEQDGERAKITLIVENGGAVMRRMGLTSAALNFIPGQRKSSAYLTMYGEIPVAVDTRRVELTRRENSGELLLDYDVYMQGERTSSACLTVTWRV